MFEGYLPSVKEDIEGIDLFESRYCLEGQRPDRSLSAASTQLRRERLCKHGHERERSRRWLSDGNLLDKDLEVSWEALGIGLGCWRCLVIRAIGTVLESYDDDGGDMPFRKTLWDVLR